MAKSLPLDANGVLGRREPIAAQRRQVQTRRWADLWFHNNSCNMVRVFSILSRVSNLNFNSIKHSQYTSTSWLIMSSLELWYESSSIARSALLNNDMPSWRHTPACHHEQQRQIKSIFEFLPKASVLETHRLVCAP